MGVYYVNGTINTAASGSLELGVAGTLNWGLDISIAAATATGQIKVFAQNDDPSSSSFVVEPFQTFQVTSGKFPGDFTKVMVSSAEAPPSTNLYVTWTPTATPTGSITIKLMKTI